MKERGIDWACRKCEEIISTVGQVIVGKDEALEAVLMALLADGHLLIEDVPGVAKTLTAEMFAQVLDLEFRRIQFTPDLLPGDITGGFIYNPRQGTFEFKEGPVFTHLLLADEVNRGTPKTQSALLEAMQERQVTVEGHCFKLESPFLVIATQNPIEFEGTYPLPEAQVDRFIMRTRIGYPSHADEREMLSRRQMRRSDIVRLPKVIRREEFLSLQQISEDVYISPDVQDYIVSISWETRRERRVQLGASPRGTLALFKLARVRSLMKGRDFVTPEDIKAVAVPALAHRILLRPELWIEGVSPEEIIKDILNRVPTPKTGGE